MSLLNGSRTDTFVSMRYFTRKLSDRMTVKENLNIVYLWCDQMWLCVHAHVCACSGLYRLPLSSSIQLCTVSGGCVSLMCFRASSSNMSPVGASDLQMTCAKNDAPQNSTHTYSPSAQAILMAYIFFGNVDITSSQN